MGTLSLTPTRGALGVIVWSEACSSTDGVLRGLSLAKLSSKGWCVGGFCGGEDRDVALVIVKESCVDCNGDVSSVSVLDRDDASMFSRETCGSSTDDCLERAGRLSNRPTPSCMLAVND